MKRSKLATWVSLALASLLVFALRPGTAAENDRDADAEIRTVLNEQQQAWNRADIDGFMKGYWQSADLTFAGSGGVTRGWQPVLERYRTTYRDAAAMGQLDFRDLEVRVLGKDAAFVVGRWHLKRANDEPGGVFTLVFQKFPEGWKIVHDHTSADEKSGK